MATVKHGDKINDGGVVWRVVDRRTNGKVADIPNFYHRSSLMSVSNNVLTTPSNLLININNQGFIGGSVAINLNTGANWDTTSPTNYATQANRAGKDFYVYLVQTSDGTLKFLLSANATVPTGYTADNSRKIGGFHCLCVNVGSISGHTLTGLTAGEVLPLSIWDLQHRPISEPEGMVWVEGIGKWVDIYLNSWDTTNSKLVSKYKGTIADGSSDPKWHGEKFPEYYGLIGKHLPMRDDFIVFAKGSNEKTIIDGGTDPVTAGGHSDTASRRMVSNYGIEDCCGALTQWTSDIEAIDSFLTSSYSASNWSEASIYNSSVDPQKYGSAYGNLRRIRVGGNWTTDASWGSRSMDWHDFPIYAASSFGARGVSKSRPEMF